MSGRGTTRRNWPFFTGEGRKRLFGCIEFLYAEFAFLAGGRISFLYLMTFVFTNVD
jgi:hypothetical protein